MADEDSSKKTKRSPTDADPGDVIEISAGAKAWLPIPGAKEDAPKDERRREVRLQKGHRYTVGSEMQLPVDLLGKVIRGDAAALLLKNGDAKIVKRASD